jgi:hypothetical protein
MTRWPRRSASSLMALPAYPVPPKMAIVAMEPPPRLSA